MMESSSKVNKGVKVRAEVRLVEATPVNKLSLMKNEESTGRPAKLAIAININKLSRFPSNSVCLLEVKSAFKEYDPITDVFGVTRKISSKVSEYVRVYVKKCTACSSRL